jgi:hypothetical protein
MTTMAMLEFCYAKTNSKRSYERSDEMYTTDRESTALPSTVHSLKGGTPMAYQENGVLNQINICGEMSNKIQVLTESLGKALDPVMYHSEPQAEPDKAERNSDVHAIEMLINLQERLSLIIDRLQDYQKRLAI